MTEFNTDPIDPGDRGPDAADRYRRIREELRDAVIDDEDVYALEAAIAETVDNQLERARPDFTDEERGELVVAVQDKIFELVLTHGASEATESFDIRDQFERLRDDFADPTATSATSGVSLAVGMLTGPDGPDAAVKLASDVMRRNYEQAGDR